MSAPLRERRSLSKEIAVCAVMTALLIGGQLAFSAVVGIEIVTVLLLTFSWSFGARSGVWTAVALGARAARAASPCPGCSPPIYCYPPSPRAVPFVRRPIF